MEFNPVISDNIEYDSEFPPTMDPVIFESEGEKIVGTMFVANGQGPHPVVLLLHGFPGNETNFDLAHSFKRAGFNVFVFHYRGTWGSAGEFLFSNGIQDTENAIKFLQLPEICQKYRIKSSEINIVGYSMGAFFGMFTGSGHKNVKNIASITGFNFGFFSKILPTMEDAEKLTYESLQKGSAILTKADPDKLLSEIKNNSEKWDLLNYIDKMKNKNLLAISALFDTIAPLDLHHQPFVTAIKKTGINIEEHILETGHGLSNKRIELATILVKWLRQNSSVK